MKILEIKNTNLVIKNENRILIENINMTVNSGDTVLISGINGVGKSSFFKALLPNNEEIVYATLENGSVFFYESENKKNLNEKIIEISQDDFLSKPSFWLRVEDVLLYGLQNIKEPKKYLKDWIEKYKPFIKDDMEKKLLKKRITSLSGGERKYVAILQGLVRCELNGVSLALLDEPINNLDAKHIIQLSDLLRRIQLFNKDFAIILITHCHAFPYINKAFEIQNNSLLEYKYELHNCFGTTDKDGFYQKNMNPAV